MTPRRTARSASCRIVNALVSEAKGERLGCEPRIPRLRVLQVVAEDQTWGPAPSLCLIGKSGRFSSGGASKPACLCATSNQNTLRCWAQSYACAGRPWAGTKPLARSLALWASEEGNPWLEKTCERTALASPVSLRLNAKGRFGHTLAICGATVAARQLDSASVPFAPSPGLRWQRGCGR